jgi:hypothetical protein
MRRRQLAVIVIGLIGVLAGWVSAQGRSSGSVLTGQDYGEIGQLLARYSQGLDLQDFDMYASVFTEDAVWRTSGQQLVGLKEMVASVKKRFADSPDLTHNRHWQNSSVITQVPGGAKGRTYLISFDVAHNPPSAGASGYYDDTFVKTSGGWHIKERILVIDRK